MHKGGSSDAHASPTKYRSQARKSAAGKEMQSLDEFFLKPSELNFALGWP